MFLLAMAGVLGDWLSLGGELPPLETASSQRVLDRYGREISHALSIDGERRYLVSLDTVPERVREAFIEAEDRHFYSHHGVDLKALARGLFLSIKHLRKASGGSTITMQLVRTQWPGMRGFLHKPAQILQALRLEARYSKGQILARYLNTVPFGNKISGVGSACRYYFSKTCDQLSAGEAATLAVLPRNPALFLKNPKTVLSRRNVLLERLLAGADPVVLAQAQAEPIHFTRASPDFFAPHFTERVLDERKGQAVIRTTLDLELQKTIQELLSSETVRRRGTGDSGAVLVLENATGEVLAYVGSPDFFDPAHGMVDGVRVLRSPGSALKPFVYELALENNWDLFSLLADVPMVFSTQRAIYEPNNYGGNFSGPRTMREALGNSKNIPALYLTSRLGEARALEHLRRFGFTSLDKSSEFYGVGLALGNGEVNLWELTQAYSTLARLGVALPATYYRGEGSRIGRRAVPAETAFLVADVLRDPEARQEEFGRFGPLEFDFEVGAKTGTSSDYRDNWTVGFTREVTVGIWRGNADSTPLEQRVSASRGTGPLFHRIVELAHRYREPGWLKRPEGVVSSRVCVLSGQKPGPFCKLTRSEYHLAGREPREICEFHKSVSVPDCHGRPETVTYVEFPRGYDEWAKGARIPNLANQLREKCGGEAALSEISAGGSRADASRVAPAIVEPLDRTVYAIDPTMPLDHQEVRFALRSPDHGKLAKVYVNDEPTELSAEGDEFFWPLRRGSFKFYVKEGKRVSNAVTVLVR